LPRSSPAARTTRKDAAPAITAEALGAALLRLIGRHGRRSPRRRRKGKRKLTKAGSHVATAKGYANGTVIEEGEPVPADIPVSTEWMKRVDGKDDSAFERAIADVLNPLPDDPDLTKLDTARFRRWPPSAARPTSKA
jgi:hypothetical protein